MSVDPKRNAPLSLFLSLQGSSVPARAHYVWERLRSGGGSQRQRQWFSALRAHTCDLKKKKKKNCFEVSL